ncbi:MAG: glycine--tRNA ligase subunit beta, partial [Chloroflexota bacterium]
REDMKLEPDVFFQKLNTLTFHSELGSVREKSARENSLSTDLSEMLNLSDEERYHLMYAVQYAKHDLTTQMVTEMPELQGIIGREYTKRWGSIPESSSDAIAEQYHLVPESKPGLTLALTDRVDKLVGLFAAGLAPTGAKDPFGLRRAAIGVVQPLLEHGIPFDLREAVKKAARLQPIEVSSEVQAQVLEFLAGRLSVLLKEAGYRYDVVDAVLAEQSANPAAAAEAVKQLQAWVERKDWSTILPGYARCVRILRSAGVEGNQLPAVSRQLFAEAEEKALYEAIRSAVHGPPSTVNEFLEIVVELIPSINNFFDKVLVMAEDETVRKNRLALVGQIAGLSRGLADLSKLEGF